jgi:predicted RNA-binding protein YlxR (DUF448 family)
MGKKNPQKKVKHIPMRMCIVTKEKKAKVDLIRIVKIGEIVKVDPKGKERGRGANIVMDVKVFDEAVKKHILERALKIKRKLKPEEIKSLRSDFIRAVELKKFRQGYKPVVIRVDKEKLEKVLSLDK